MKQQAFVLAILVSLLPLAGHAAPPAPPAATAGEPLAAALTPLLAGEWRSAANKARDVYRHPLETLGFFGLKPEMTVIEITPGGGWYTELLGPLLKDKGKLVAALVEPPSAASEGTQKYLARSNADYRAKLAADPAHYNAVEVREFSLKEPHLGADGSADMVVTFRNVHNFLMWNADRATFQAMFRVLKPGGVLGVTDHRAVPGTDLETSRKTGYVPEDYVIPARHRRGFRAGGKSEVNANPKDTKDYPAGVWTLPPTLALKDKDREKYLAIGESDRMTLRFVKPAKAAAN